MNGVNNPGAPTGNREAFRSFATWRAEAIRLADVHAPLVVSMEPLDTI
jgi:hypothetical protein